MTREEMFLNEELKILKENGMYPHLFMCRSISEPSGKGCKICEQGINAIQHNSELITLYIQQALGDQ